MSVNATLIKEAELSNNCPECYSNDSLRLQFYQKHLENLLYTKATSTITESLKCSKCKTTIYPVRYTEDIERVRDFYFKTLERPATGIKLRLLSWILLLAVIIAGAGIYWYLQQQNLFTTDF
ncbi:hypothetical protein [Robertkochia aurantiaca]|uniref:hypothetical protein n=1 Tax=Robertkochia aurantiaca TaxID=2873700 RepID=UPI001CCF599F|nr:hypothetical protein [Robertkochia sp. 3YJGBD-33]